MNHRNILMVAAENDALPNAKVGGIGDVIRDIPPALARLNCRVHVVVPSYGFLHQLPGAKKVVHFPVAFGGELLDVQLYLLEADALKSEAHPNVQQWVIHHPGLSPCGANVYCNDGDSRPFATDATKYALFCAAVGQAILQNAFGILDVVHLHDWHTALLTVLRAFDPHYARLQKILFVFTIHNLALQGVRPFKGDPSSLATWFPTLQYDAGVICDPEFIHCINPMRAGIVLADKVHAVSPSYAKEIQRPSEHGALIFGGEGLECDLMAAAAQNRLEGILNGCEYPNKKSSARLTKTKLAEVIETALEQWVAKEHRMASSHWLAAQRLKNWLARKGGGYVLTSVGRLTAQKVALMQMQCTYAKKRQSALDHILASVDPSTTLILVGNGEADLVLFLQQVSARHKNFIFLCGYNEHLAAALYASGDLFLMPSSFEPCGISQMLAMRSGQPCVVHGVGGLKDTVTHEQTGFVFSGDNGEEQANAWIKTTLAALQLAKADPGRFKAIGQNASAARFEWHSVAKSYLRNLYGVSD